MMTRICTKRFGLAALLAGTALSSSALAAPIDWVAVANSNDMMPGSTAKFNSFNQPSISGNAACTVVFRARSKGPGQPVRGIYFRALCSQSANRLVRLKAVGDLVPQPNNTGARFNEFPAFPRIDMTSGMIATRGQSQPVWRYTLPDNTETRTGTSGIYVKPFRSVLTGASQLGAVRGFEEFEVPGAVPGTRFDQFPGAPSATARTVIAFKGNYTEGSESRTGVFYRNVSAGGGSAPVQLVANSLTRIPGKSTVFGSTAPPSAANGKMVFLGVDNEEMPTMGGIYQATMKVAATTPQPAPALRTLVKIGGPVPGVTGAAFTRLGEGMSYTGRYVGYWGAWGTETRDIKLQCPTDGNQALIDFCNSQYPDGFETSVPVNQGIFVRDTWTSKNMLISRTKAEGNFLDFLYWVFSGRPPGAGGGEDDDLEPARWRSSAFTAVSVRPSDGNVATAFKGTKNNGAPVGIYVRSTPTASIIPILEEGVDATTVDAEAPAGADVVTVGIERDGFRKCRLALAVGMLDSVTSESWAGIYVTGDACGR
ncbi:conserved exported hypothetical protein [uncultured Defluviicoccus sp.]|uniref:Uncharacterized protein n=1 Tax=metagenome TaxID=256318 RepID=A0A380TIV2_9ZZZZ|nr:conserved exported hypothetical protein [uncultured Defluviicoccus sp.]